MAVKEIKVKSNIPIYSIGVSWILYSLVFKMYRIIDFIIAACISAVVYMALYFIIPDKNIEITEPDFVKSGDKTADEIVERGNIMLGELLEIKGSIDNVILKNNIDELHKTGSLIYGYVSKNPSSAPSIKKFNDYYFPETVKILKAYDEIDDFAGKNANETKTKIEKSIQSMINAFNKQLDNLLYDKTFDVRTDIKVLETLLAEEGLSGKED